MTIHAYMTILETKPLGFPIVPALIFDTTKPKALYVF